MKRATRRRTSAAIHDACEAGDVEQVAQLLREDPACVRLAHPVGDLPLHLASRANHAAVVDLLLKAGADVNARGNRGDKPLHAAAQGGSSDAMRRLISAGGDLHLRNDREQTPLLTAALHVEIGRPKTQKVVDILLKSGADYDIRTAILQGDATRVSEILASEGLPDDQTDLLLLAISTRLDETNTEIVQQLLAAGANPNARSRNWPQFPLQATTDVETVKQLLVAGANPNVTDHEGKTPLAIARKFKLRELAEVLKEYGAK